jgi:hypothetical protein
MNSARFAQALDAFAAVSAQDPAREIVAGEARPRELVQSERLAAWVERLAPDASEALRLAARCQHIGRFRVPRSSYPEGRSGYLRWRSELSRRHAETAEGVLSALAYDPLTMEHLRKIVRKQDISTDPEVQTMEDALCLCFLEYEFDEFAKRHSDEKLIAILRKTWRKMSPRARELALTLPLGARAAALVTQALAVQGRSP